MAGVLAKTPASLVQLLAAAERDLPREAALLAAADWCWETAGGASLYGNNPGNLTCGAVPGAACGSNPLVTSGLSFADFGSLDDGASAYAAGMRAWLPKLSVVVVPPLANGVTFGQAATVAAVVIVGGSFGLWAAEGFKRPRVLAR